LIRNMTYELLVGKTDKDEWEQRARRFADYSIYQTWAYQQVRAETSGQDLSRAVVLDENGNAITMCQIRIKHIKPLALRIGYVQWGPLLRGCNSKLDCVIAAVKKLREVYLDGKVNILRIVPNLYKDENGLKMAQVLEAGGFKAVPTAKLYHTMILPLDIPADRMISNLHRSWKRGLTKAEHAGLEIKEGFDPEYFSILEHLYRAAVQRKGFKGLDPEEFVRSQQMLSNNERMNVVVAYFNGQPVAAHATSHLGDTAVGTLAASSEKGLELSASYLVWWRTILAAKSFGMKRYDLGGIDPRKNPTVYQFKQRMGANVAFHIGTFEACTSPMVEKIWRMAERAHSFIRGMIPDK